MIRFAIIGTGRISPNHARAIKEIEEAELIAVCDIDRQKVMCFADEYHVPHYSTDYKEIIENSDVDVVNICTPSGLHAEMAIAAMEKGKHVIIEKPVALSLEDAQNIINVAKRTGVKATVAFQNRFNLAVVKTREALEQGKFGKMSHANATIRWYRDQEYYDQAKWRGTEEMDGGTLMNQCIHDIDLLRWMMGPVKKVMGKTTTRFRKIEMEDVGAAVLEFESGAIGIIEGASTVYPKDLEATLNLFGETGTVVIGGRAINMIEKWRFKDDLESEEEILASYSTIPSDVYGFGHKDLLLDMMKAVKEDTEPSITLEDGKNALEIILAIYESSLHEKVVYISE